MRNSKIHKCLLCNSEVVKTVVLESKAVNRAFVKRIASDGIPVYTILPVQRKRYDPRGRCYYHLKKFLREQNLKGGD
jgi:hypothetical protein